MGETWVPFCGGGGGPANLTCAARDACFKIAGTRDAIKNCSGIVNGYCRFKLTDITDGSSETYLIGEKYINPDWYTTGTWLGNDQGPFTADDWDNCRSASALPWDSVSVPMQDRSGSASPQFGFGSAHASVFNMSFCDGSVRSINYTISEPIHRHLSNRKDGIPVDSNSY